VGKKFPANQYRVQSPESRPESILIPIFLLCERLHCSEIGSSIVIEHYTTRLSISQPRCSRTSRPTQVNWVAFALIF
jgi:hypothetical protein